LITFKIEKSHPLFAILPCPAHVLPLRKTYDWNALQMALWMRDFVRRENVDIVHTFHETSDLWGGFVARMSRVPAVVSSRRDMGILRQPKHQLAYRLLNSQFDLVLTVSEEVRRFSIERDGLSPNRVSTLYNGLELEKISSTNGFASIRSSLGLDKGAPFVLTVGHIRRVKGIDILVETAAIVQRQFPKAVFAVVGSNNDPQHFQELEARIANLGLGSNVRFLGRTENVSTLLKAGDVFFLPSRSEGFSNALIEAMACNLPCVATRVGGNAEAIVEGQSGYLIENEDAEAAADRIMELLRNPETAKKMGEAGRKIVETKFTADIMSRNLVSHYERLLAHRRN
jgi:glycosyltransferase involved in cell wall biosynthesis